ncbi:MAG TPA: aminotransferase class I/II-fold pyridoxal phosphate-dependent enzyme [Acidimicrobiales bacterium]|jgi:cystathionine beta-lyase/cystathionine gamma-synthase|nr:aminotransferase class I/II-fold pyridoxal phosphate-dependent enzyme [Acidimicrobiales bacterium]
MNDHPRQGPQHTETTAITAGRSAGSDGALGSVLYASSAFEVAGLDELRRKAVARRADRFYSRYANPTVSAFEEAMAELEGAEAALAFASGMGAVATFVMALCSPGDHVVVQRQIYSGTQLFLQGPAARFGIEVTWVDGTVPGELAAAVRPGRTMLVLTESPANPQLALTDLDELGAITGPFTLVDSTFATPICQRPHDHGVDLVLHSATKGIGGHNDATLGVVTGPADLLGEVWAYSVLHGACASPFDAMNGLRGARTLGVRVERQSASALRLAEWFEAHPQVAYVRYPHLPSHPQYELAKRQMVLGGSMLAVELAGGRAAGRHLVEHVRLARGAATLGGPETLVVSPAASTHVGLTDEELEVAGIGPGLVRISVGLEHVDDLIADFDQALAAARG